MRVTGGLAPRLPTGPWVGNGLIGSRFILAPELEPCGLSQPLRLVDQPLVCSVSASVTVTTPALRLRCAVPVGHQVRVCW
jgi:hypothetical protein